MRFFLIIIMVHRWVFTRSNPPVALNLIIIQRIKEMRRENNILALSCFRAHFPMWLCTKSHSSLVFTISFERDGWIIVIIFVSDKVNKYLNARWSIISFRGACFRSQSQSKRTNEVWMNTQFEWIGTNAKKGNNERKCVCVCVFGHCWDGLNRNRNKPTAVTSIRCHFQ